ncbi:MAG TPA: DUF2071 domain-containing protein [Fimbriimonas sp.]|nr:DUF2071 domain-containing protein [Fimbriimonas sp.]
MLDPSLALELRERPAGKRLMFQRWTDLLFLHYPLDPAIVQPMIPNGLTVDTFPDSAGIERAWIGFVPFRITDLSFGRAKIPTAHSFLETNVRTYVHLEGREPGVWFFSLEAESLLAVIGARASYGLPYWHADLSLLSSEGTLIYSGRRRGRRNPAYQVCASVGEPLGTAEPGAFEFFLVERYLLYSTWRGRLCRGQVHHRPYQLFSATFEGCAQDLTEAAGLPSLSFIHAVYSPRVEVDVFPIQKISN